MTVRKDLAMTMKVLQKRVAQKKAKKMRAKMKRDPKKGPMTMIGQTRDLTEPKKRKKIRKTLSSLRKKTQNNNSMRGNTLNSHQQSQMIWA